jgi:hypothetical protein
MQRMEELTPSETNQTMSINSGIIRIVTKRSLHSLSSDCAFWQSQPYSVRLETLEQIRREYHAWRYGVEPGFQRVYTIIKR